MPLHNLQVHLGRGEHLQARREAERLIGSGGLSEHELASAYRGLAIAFYNLHELYAAAKAGEKALALAETLRDPSLTGKAKRDLGWYYFSLGDTHLAEEMLQRFLAECECDPEHAALLPEVYHNLALVCRQKRRYCDAILLHQKAARLFMEAGSRSSAMLSYRGLIFCYLLQGEPDNALPYIETVADYLREHEDPSLTAHHLTDWARYWRLKGDLEASLAFCEEAMVPGRPGTDDHVLAEASLTAAENACDLGNRTEASILAHKALNHSLKAGHPLLMNRVATFRRRLQEWATPA